MKGNGYEAHTFYLLYVFVIVFGLALILTSHNRFGKPWRKRPIETIPLNYSTRRVNGKQKIVQGCVPSNIKCSSFVITCEVRRLS